MNAILDEQSAMDHNLDQTRVANGLTSRTDPVQDDELAAGNRERDGRHDVESRMLLDHSPAAGNRMRDGAQMASAIAPPIVLGPRRTARNLLALTDGRSQAAAEEGPATPSRTSGWPRRSGSSPPEGHRYGPMSRMNRRSSDHDREHWYGEPWDVQTEAALLNQKKEI